MSKPLKEGGIVAWALRHHKIMLLLTALLLVLGGYALPKMPKQEFPAFTIRTGVVAAVYPGATSAQIEEQVTRKLERYLLSHEEVKKENTYSMTRDGIVYVMVDLHDHITNKLITEFYYNLRQDLQTFKTQLPAGVLALVVVDDFAETSAVLVTLESQSKTYSQLATLLDDLEDRLRPLPIVSRLRRYGEQNEEINIYLDKEKLATYGVDRTQVMSQLFTQGLVTSGGGIDGAQAHLPIHLTPSLGSVQDIQELVVMHDPITQSALRIKDIARVVREYSTPSQYITNNGCKCVMVSIEMAQGNNMIEMGRRVNQVLQEFEASLPADVHVFRIADQPEVVQRSVYTFLREMLIAILAVIAVIVTLLPLRVAGVAALSIPVTIFSTLGLMYLFGIELNTVSLACLLVVLGMVVDDSIVVLDNYVVLLEQGMERKKASITAAKNYFKSVFSATLAISITFFPFLYTFPSAFVDFIFVAPFTITLALMISLVVSMLFIPYVQSVLIKKGVHEVAQDTGSAPKKQRMSMLDRFERFYERALAYEFKRPIIAVLGALVILISPVFIYGRLSQRILPKADRNQFVVEMFLAPGTQLERTAQVADSLRVLLAQDARILSVTSFMGNSSPRFHATYVPQMPSSAFAQFIVNTPSPQITNSIVGELQTRYSHYFPDAYLRFRQMDYQMLSQYDVEVRLISQDKAQLMQVADSLSVRFRQIPKVMHVANDFEGYMAGISVEVNAMEAGRVGVNRTLLTTNLASRFVGLPVATVWEDGRPLSVKLRTDFEEGALTPESLGNEYVQGLIPGVNVPLRQLATLTPDWNISQIVRRNGFPTLTLSLEIAHGSTAKEVMAQVRQVVNQFEFPDGVRYEYGGTEGVNGKIMPGILKGIACAILIIFFILVFHFQNISLALLVLASTSLSIFGAFVGTWILGLDFGLTSYLGLVSLIGLVVRNGIIMFDYAQELRQGGATVREAAFQAGCRRIRPIFLTAMAASMGVIPMIISMDTLWAPMATVICFGALTAMVFVTLILPVFYWFLYRKEDLKTV